MQCRQTFWCIPPCAASHRTTGTPTWQSAHNRRVRPGMIPPSISVHPAESDLFWAAHASPMLFNRFALFSRLRTKFFHPGMVRVSCACILHLHSVLPFLTFHTFSWGDIISTTNKVNTVTVVLVRSCFRYFASSWQKMLLPRCWWRWMNAITLKGYHYSTFARWWQSVHFCPWAAKGGLDCSHVVGLVPYPHSKGSDLDQTEMLGNSSTHDCKPPPSCHQSPAQSTFSDSCTRSLLLKSSWLWVP